jgi:hypothetical protein
MNKALEKQLYNTKKSLDPDHDVFDSLKQMFALIEMFYIYLENKFNDDPRKNS